MVVVDHCSVSAPLTVGAVCLFVLQFMDVMIGFFDLTGSQKEMQEPMVPGRHLADKKASPFCLTPNELQKFAVHVLDAMRLQRDLRDVPPLPAVSSRAAQGQHGGRRIVSRLVSRPFIRSFASCTRATRGACSGSTRGSQ